MYSWYLNAVSCSWGAVVSDDLKTIFPVTYTTKVGVSQFHQAIFTREFSVIGSGFTIEDVLSFLNNRFKLVQFRTNEKINSVKDQEKRVFQTIDLKNDFENKYSTNAKRLIKKANKNFTFKKVKCIDELMKLVNDNIAHKIKEFTPSNLSKLKNLMEVAVKNQMGGTIAVFNENQIVAAGFFLKDKSRITYLKGASTDLAKKNGAMYGLMDYAFQSFKNECSTFDFGGSNIDNVAVFYKKFGAINKTYYNYTINDLPLWFNLLKKLKR